MFLAVADDPRTPMISSEQSRKNGVELDVAPEKDSGDEWSQLLTRHFAEITGHAARLAHLRAARREFKATQLITGVFLGLTLAMMTMAVGLAGVWLVFLGLPATLTQMLGGRDWMADLLSGFILVSAVVVLLLAVQKWSERRILRKLEEQDED